MITDAPTEQERQLIRLAWALSVAGLLPFAGLALALLYLGDEHGLFYSLFDVFKTWSAMVLSFLGGIRWGLAISKHPAPAWDLAICVLPPAAGWLALFLPDSYTILVLLLAYCAMGAWDSFSINAGIAPQWFGKIRIFLTFLVAPPMWWCFSRSSNSVE